MSNVRWSNWVSSGTRESNDYIYGLEKSNAQSLILGIITYGFFGPVGLFVGMASSLYGMFTASKLDALYYKTETFYRYNKSDSSEYQKKNVTYFYKNSNYTGFIEKVETIETRSDD